MRIEIGRKDSCGLKGTIENAEHHAENVLPLIREVSAAVRRMDFDLWTQFNNLHIFTTHEGTKYTLRPLCFSKHNYGIRLSLMLSRGNEVRLMDFFEDEADRLIEVLEGLSLEKIL